MSAFLVILHSSSLSTMNVSQLGFLDVTLPPYSLDRTGATDVTAGLQAAIIHARRSFLAVYLRHGTYLVSKPLLLLESNEWKDKKAEDMNNTWACRFQPNVLLGERAHWPSGEGAPSPFGVPSAVGGPRLPVRPIIRLADGAAGFDTPGKVVPVLDFTRADNGHVPYIDGTNFNQVLRGIDIVIGKGTPSATGVMMPGAQGCSVQDVTVTVGSGYSGITGGSGAGGGHTNVAVYGGRVGLDYTVSLNAPATARATLINQTHAAVLYKGLEAATFVGALIKPAHPSVPALLANISNTTDRDWGQVTFVDSVVDYEWHAETRAAAACTAFVTSHSLVLTSVYMRGCASFVPGVAGAAQRDVWAHAKELAVSVAITSSGADRNCKPATMPIYIDGKRLPKSLLADVELPSKPAPPEFLSSHSWDEESFPTWDGIFDGSVINAHDFGAAGDGETDDTNALQAAVDAASVARVHVFLPKGFYRLSRSLNLTHGCKGLVGAARSLSVLMPMSAGLARSPAPLLSVPNSTLPVVLTMMTMVVWEHSADVYALEWRNSHADSVYRSSYSYRITECYYGFPHPTPVPLPPSAPSIPCKPSKNLSHPLLLLSDGAAGRFYNLENEDFLYESPTYRHLLVRDTAGPLRFYSLNMEHATSEANAELTNVSFVHIFAFKTEGAWRDLIQHGGRHNPAVGLWVRNSSNVYISSFGGNMRAMSTGTRYPAGWAQYPSSIYRFEETSPITAANLVDQFQFGPDNDWNFVYERFAGVERMTAHCERPVYYKRG